MISVIEIRIWAILKAVSKDTRRHLALGAGLRHGAQDGPRRGKNRLPPHGSLLDRSNGLSIIVQTEQGGGKLTRIVMVALILTDDVFQ